MTGYHKNHSWVSAPSMTGLVTTDDYGRIIDTCPVWSWVIDQRFRVLIMWLVKVDPGPIEIIPLNQQSTIGAHHLDLLST